MSGQQRDWTGFSNVLVRVKNAKRRDEMSQRNAFVRLPLVVGFYIINKDDKVLIFALVVDLGLHSLAASHLDVWLSGWSRDAFLKWDALCVSLLQGRCIGYGR